jgi:hypothetical protein
MVGAANSDSARISFLGSTKGELAQKLDRGKDAAGGLLKFPPNRAKWSPITRLTNSAWGGDTYYSSAVRRTQGLGLLRGLPMHFLQSAMEPSSAEPKGKNRRTVEYSQEAFVVRLPINILDLEICIFGIIKEMLSLKLSSMITTSVIIVGHSIWKRFSKMTPRQTAFSKYGGQLSVLLSQEPSF